MNLWGIENEAEIYCNSTIIALKLQKEYVEDFIQSISENMVLMKLESHTYTEAVDAIIIWTEDMVERNNWGICDEDGVSWFLGIYVTAYVRSLRKTICPFEKLFKDCFIRYFLQKSK